MEDKNPQPLIDCGDSYYFNCPHCGDLTQVLKVQVNCKIFRHAMFFTTLPPTPHTFSYEYRESVANIFDSMLIPGKVTDIILTYVGELPQYIPTESINPHMPKEICDRLVAEGRVLGCAKPLLFVFNLEGDHVEKCGYI